MRGSVSRIARRYLLLLIVGVASAFAPVTLAHAAEPASGTVDGTTAQVTWSGGPLVFTTLGTGCQPVAGPTCDVFELTIGALPADAPDVVISGAAESPGDILWLYVYGPDGTLVAEDTNLGANPRAILRRPPPGTYSVRFEALLGSQPTVSYKALAARADAGPAPDAEVPCTGEDGGLGPPPQEVLDATLQDPGHEVRLDVLVLLDGVDEGFARSFFETVAIPYQELDIRVAATFRSVPEGAITSDVTTEIIDQTKNLLPRRRVPDEFDVVELLTHRDIEALGLKAVAGQAECIGGARYKEHSFNVSEAQQDVDQAGVTFGPLRLVPHFAAKITAHEIGHLFGGQHHFANCVEGLHSDAATGGDSSPCSLMFNSADFIALRFGTVNGRIVRGYALMYAAANDAVAAPPADPAVTSGSPDGARAEGSVASAPRHPATGGAGAPLLAAALFVAAFGVRSRLKR